MNEEYRRWRAERSAKYLEKVRGMALKIMAMAQSIERQRAIAEGDGAIDYTKDHVSSPASDGRMADAVQRLQEFAAQREAQRRDYAKEIEAAYRAIDRMDAPECAAALEMHYLAGRSWGECAEALGYSKPGMMELRRRALCDFYDVIPAKARI